MLSGFAPAETAKAGDLTFAENAGYLAHAERSAASAVIVAGHVTSASKVVIQVANARVAFAKVLSLFFTEPQFAAGVHPTAVVAKSAQLDPSVHVGPYCVVSEGVRIGARSVLQSGNFIGEGCLLAEAVNLFPNVTLYSRTEIGKRVRIHSGTVIGADGFGYVPDAGIHYKIPQTGRVVIGDDVEIGANTTIDRGTLGATVIGKGTKIDNLVQIGHNVQIGEHCLIVSLTGIAGSCVLGNYVVLTGQVGVIDHVKIGSQVMVGAQSCVTKSIPDGEKWLGFPAMPEKQAKHQFIAVKKLPELLKRVSEIEKKLGLTSKPPE